MKKKMIILVLCIGFVLCNMSAAVYADEMPISDMEADVSGYSDDLEQDILPIEGNPEENHVDSYEVDETVRKIDSREPEIAISGEEQVEMSNMVASEDSDVISGTNEAVAKDEEAIKYTGEIEIPAEQETKELEEIQEIEEAEESEIEEDLEKDSVPSVQYRTHVQTFGWQNFVSDGAMSGTQGQSKRLEGIEIKISGAKDLGIRYATHIQTYGWETSWRENGAMSGTSGESKRLEAIRIELTGSDAANYDVWYCVHAQKLGWLNWAKNGEDAGTAGYSYRLEGIKIRVLPKGSSAPGKEGNSSSAFYSQNDGPSFTPENNGVAYNTHVQTYGWQDYVYNGGMAGTSGQSKRLEGIHITLVNPEYSGGIEYRTHVQTYGWQDWKQNGAMSGTSGEAKRLEAIQIKLTGEMAAYYDVYYRVHAQNCGWMGWAKNGEQAGTAGYSFRLEAIQIVLVKKGDSTPSIALNGYTQTTEMPFTDKNVNRTGFDIDAYYGGPDISHANFYYSGSTMVIDATIYNYRIFQADYYDWITIELYDKYNNLFASKTFNNIPLNMASYTYKQLQFTIENTPVKNINPLDGGELYMTYNYYYTYTM